MRPFPRHRRTGHASASSLRARWLAAARNLAITFALLAAQLTAAEAQRTRFEPEGGTGLTVKSSGARTGATAQRFMVAAANPLAVDAGIAVLKRGGSAVDAAIAVQLVLNLVEPQSSGIGGGAFLLHWDAASKSVTTYDGRETAPAAAKPDRFFKNGKRLPFRTAVHSGLSIGTPGLVKLLSAVHEKHGKLAWADLFQPAITLARDGFEISPRLHGLVSRYGAAAFGPRARAYFFDARGAAHPVGYLRTNLDFAATLQAIADGGPDAFYTGPIARAVIAAAKGAPNARGDLTMEDLAGYEVRERPPVCATYRDYSVCGMGPPSSGALTVAQTLAMIEPMTSAAGPGSAMSPAALHAIAEASKRAFADRGRYMADPDFVAVPSKGLLEPGYVATRRQTIDPRRAAIGRVKPGTPPGVRAEIFGRDQTKESVGTSHISIVDADGNAVSMTTTIESAFGARVWAAGFLLNNELTDFSFAATDADGRPIANAVAPGKRPRSSMAPTLVFAPDGELFAVLGSPGGSRIINYVTRTLVALIDWGADPQAAVDMPNFGSRGGPFELELQPVLNRSLLSWDGLARLFSRPPAVWHAIRMRGYGHRIRPDRMTSGLHVIVRKNGRLIGGADPRREGVARGE